MPAAAAPAQVAAPVAAPAPSPVAVRIPAPPAAEEERPTGMAMRRGMRGRCPACGEGRLFSRYLRVVDHCPSCDEAMHHHRADDGPAYVTVLVVSHVLTPLLLAVFVLWRPSVEAMLVGFLGAAVVMCLLMLPLVKGGFVGLQWARRMHGFGAGEARSE